MIRYLLLGLAIILLRPSLTFSVSNITDPAPFPHRSTIGYIQAQVTRLMRWQIQLEYLNNRLFDYEDKTHRPLHHYEAVPVDDLLSQTIEDLSLVENSAILIQYLQQYHKHVDKLEAITRELTQASYSSEEVFKEKNILFNKAEVYFQDLNTLTEKIGFELQALASLTKYNYTQEEIDINRTIELCAQIMRSMRSGSETTVRNIHQQLKQKLSRQSRSLEQAVYTRLKAWIEEFSRQVDVYLKSEDFPAKYHSQGKAYYFYTHRLLPLYNSPETGLVAIYNQILSKQEDNASILLTEPIWFQSLLWIAEAEEEIELSRGNWVFLIDASGSMQKDDKLLSFKRYFASYLQHLSPSDKISVISCSGEQITVLASGESPSTSKLKSAVSGIKPVGEGPDVMGFERAYQEATNYLHPDTENRIVLISDGGFEIPPELRSLVADQAGRNIKLYTLYVGNYPEIVRRRLQKLAGLGNGRYLVLRPGKKNTFGITKLLSQ